MADNSLAVIKSDFNINLTKAEISVQALQNEVDGLVLNEDHMADIKAAITKIDKYKKNVEDTYSGNGAEAYKKWQEWVNAKKDMLSLVSPMEAKLNPAYTKLCQDVEKRKRESDLKEAKEKAIREGMTNNILSFSTKIAECKTDQELVNLEKLLNLEKTRKEKYGDLLPEMEQLLSTLSPAIKSQKEAIRTLNKLSDQETKALESGNDEEVLEILDKKEALETQIQENKIKVQENTVYNVSGRLTNTLVATPIYPTVKAKRTSYKYEVIDLGTVIKKTPEFTTTIINNEKVDEFLKSARIQKELEDNDEFIENGIKYFIQRKY